MRSPRSETHNRSAIACKSPPHSSRAARSSSSLRSAARRIAPERRISPCNVPVAIPRLAAARFGIKEVVLPDGNRNDWAELPEEVRNKLKDHFIRQASEALPLILREK